MDKPEIGSRDFCYRVNLEWAKPSRDHSFGTTHGVVEDKDGYIYIHHTGSPSIFVFEPDGKFVRAFGEAYAGSFGLP